MDNPATACTKHRHVFTALLTADDPCCVAVQATDALWQTHPNHWRPFMLSCRFGVQASLAGVPALAATAPGMPAALPTAAGLPGIRPMLAPPAAGPPAAALAAAAPGVPGVRPVMAPGAAGGPRPLRLDASGREVDEAGNVIQVVRAPVATSLVSVAWLSGG